MLAIDMKRNSSVICCKRMSCVMVTREVYQHAVSKAIRLPEFTRWVKQTVLKVLHWTALALILTVGQL